MLTLHKICPIFTLEKDVYLNGIYCCCIIISNYISYGTAYIKVLVKVNIKKLNLETWLVSCWKQQPGITQIKDKKLHNKHFMKSSQQTSLKSTMETLEQCVKYVQSKE